MNLFRTTIAVAVSTASILLVAGPTAVALEVPPLPIGSIVDSLLSGASGGSDPADVPNAPANSEVGGGVSQGADPNAVGDVCCASTRDRKEVKGASRPDKLPGTGA